MPEPIIDNMDVNLHDSLTRACRNAETLDIAVGYFHVSGFNELRRSLAGIKQIRLIMGDETDKWTAAQLRKGHDPTETIRERILEMLNNTPDGDSDTLMELHEYCKTGRMKVRLYIRSKFHAKAYILKGDHAKSAFIGSSNLSRAGLGYEGGNVELNFLAHDLLHVDALSEWYETVWEKSAEYNDELIKLMESTESYARSQNDKEYVSPRELFKIMACELLDSEVESDPDMLAEFQKIGVINAQDKIRKFGGVIIADSVGLGKTYIGMELIRRAQSEGRNVLILVPASVERNWEREIGDFGSINRNKSRLRILTHEKLSRTDLGQDSGGKEWRDLRKYDYVLVDEAHRFKKHGAYANETYSGNKNHANLVALKAGRDVPCVLLTATPLNNTVYDLKHLIQLFTNEAKLKNYNSDLDFSHFDEYKKLEDQIKKQQREGRGESNGTVYKSAPFDEEIGRLRRQQQPHIDGIVKVLGEVMILRTRHDIGSRYPGLTINGKPVSFQQTVLRQMRCEFPDEYGPLYRGAYDLLDRLILPHVSMRENSSPQSHSLYLMLLYKRLDSSIHSFVVSIERLLETDRRLLDRTKRMGWRRAVEGVDVDDLGLDGYTMPQGDGGQYGDKAATAALSDDITMIEEFIEANVEPIRTGTGKYLDPKLEMLQAKLDGEPGKVLIFTEYVDTARYLYERLSTHGREKDCVSGQGNLGTDRETEMKVKLFAPVANGYAPAEGEREIDVLITTGALAEGVNLQDCRTAVNYDIPWNPMKIVQRVGRIDRIGSNTRATVFNILPDRRFDGYFLNLLDTVSRKVDTITSILGNENPILTDEDGVSPKSFGEILLGMGEVESIEEYERMGRNRLFKSVRTKEEKSAALLGIKEVVNKLGLTKSDFRDYDRTMYCAVDARRADKRGVFAMFRVYDERNGDKLGTVTIFRDGGGVCSKIETEDFLDFITMHEHVLGHRRTSDMENPLEAIERYFNDKHFQPILKRFSHSVMGTKQNVPPVQEIVMGRLTKIKNYESLGDAVEVSALHGKFAGIVLLDSEGVILSSLFGDRGLRRKIGSMDRDEFIRTVSDFYEQHIQNNPNYAARRNPDDIKYRIVCWGAFA